jgi:3-hydroxyanthranilate 3,4-dioxygenase
MSKTTMALPFNLQGWIDKHLPQSLGAIGNKEVFKGSDFIFQIIKGPNARNDFPIVPWDYIF